MTILYNFAYNLSFFLNQGALSMLENNVAGLKKFQIKKILIVTCSLGSIMWVKWELK